MSDRVEQVKSELVMTKKVCNTSYSISEFINEKGNKVYYVHMTGYSHIPCTRTFSSSLKQAKIKLAQKLSVTMEELKTLKAS